jgi:hypothetical protein
MTEVEVRIRRVMVKDVELHRHERLQLAGAIQHELQNLASKRQPAETAGYSRRVGILARRIAGEVWRCSGPAAGGRPVR